MINVTDLSLFLYCQRKLYLQKVLKIVEPLKETLVLGAIRHETHEGINNIEEELVKSITRENLAMLFEKYKINYSEILRNAIRNNRKQLDLFNLKPDVVFKNMWPFIMRESVLRAQNIFNFIERNNLFGNELWEKLIPKLKSEIKIEDENLDLKGIIDQIAIYEDQVVPFELKTGSLPKEGIWPSHKIQLQAYMVMLKNSGKNVKEGIVRYLDYDEDRQIAYNPFIDEEVKKQIKAVNDLLKSKTIPAVCGNIKKCEKCGLRSECLKL